MRFGIFPAIDIYRGKAVRLLRGSYETVFEYGEPVEIAVKYENAGAKNLHIVDLDGAKAGCPANIACIEGICKEFSGFIQAGGGARDLKSVEMLLNAGVGRVVVGTAAICDLSTAKSIVASYGERVALAADVMGRNVRVKGWLEDTGIDALQIFERAAELKIGTIIYTNISKDGTLEGYDLKALEEFISLKGENQEVIASGGVSSVDDISRISKMKRNGVSGLIIGKALYEKRFDIRAALEFEEE